MNLLACARRIFASATLALCARHGLNAQVLRGVVRDSASQQGIPGVVLVLLDANGGALGRNITNEEGRFAVALTAAMQRVQFLRIGFRPRTVTIPATTTQELDVTMPSIPTLLSAVNVVDEATCPRRADRAAAFALWEQAKTALLATVVTRETNPANVVRLHYERRLDDNDRVIAQTVRIDSASTDRPWVAPRPAAAFVEDGFAVDSAHARWYSGPDADVMIDDAFARGYCFNIAEPDSARPHAVGLGFIRANRRRGHVDIEGTVWIDSVSRSLTDIVFHYVGLDGRSERLRPGGRIEFQLMQNGAAMIDRWWLRVPAAKVGVQVRGFAPLEARESGGEVAHAQWRNGRAWQASLGTVRGHIPGDGGGGTVIRLLDTDYRATADSAGNFEISNLLPGPYSIGAINGPLADLDIVLKTLDGFTAVRDSVVRVNPGIPSAAQYIAGKCDADSPRYAVVVARVLMPTGEPAEDAHVEVRAISGGSVQRVVEGKADANGLFFVCRAPRDTPLQIAAERDGAALSIVLQELTTDIAAARLELKAPRRRP
jgi:Carboxypeptidase regulatory-like domain